MLSTSFIVTIVLGFFGVIATLFWLTPRITIPARYKHIVFSLSLGVHCTSWAMLGTVAQAAQHQWALFPTYLGIILTMLLGYKLVNQVSQECQQSNSASLADYMAARWPHISWYGAFITFIACATVIPYIALQLMALTNIGELVLRQAPENLGFWVTLLLIVSIGLLTFSRGTPAQQNQSLMVFSAISAVFKLSALLSVLWLVCYVLFDSPMQLLSSTYTQTTSSANNAWLSYLSFCVLGLVAVFCSPRQFHMAFVINRDTQLFHESKWQFSLYLIAMGLPILPIALAGDHLFNEQLFSADLYTLALPLFNDVPFISALVLLGILAAAIPMILISSISCSVMLANNVISPIWVKRTLESASRLTSKKVLSIRRATICIFLIAAYLFFEFVAKHTELVFSGFIALALIAQLLPSFLFTIRVKYINLVAILSGILTGLLCWLSYTLFPLFFYELYQAVGQSDATLEFHLLVSLGLNALVILTLQPYCQQKLAHYNARALLESQPSVPNIPNTTMQQLCEEILPRDDYLLLNETPSDAEEFYDKAFKALVNRIGQSSTQMLISNLQNTQSPESLVGWVQQTQQEMAQTIEQETQELAAAKLQAEAENKSKTRFLAAAGHDLMQPFNAAQLLSNILSEKTQNTPQHQIAIDLQDALKHAGSLLTSLLEVTKLDSGVMQARKQTFSLDSIIYPLVREFSVIASEQNITLRYLPSNIWLHTDPNLLTRCCQNLIANAVRYTGLQKEQHKKQKSKIIIGCKRQHGKVLFIVADNGPGIPETQHQAIFDEFTQLNTQLNTTGLGIGLTIVKGICQLLDIKIQLRSKEGKGSIFGLELPVCEAPNVSKQRPVTNPANTPIKDLEVWIVENDPAVAKAMLTLFTHWGIRSTWFKKEHDLFAAIKKNQTCDVILLDYHLDDNSLGIQVWDDANVLWQERNMRIPIAILTTADRSSELRENAKDLGMTYLPKPIKHDVLKRIIINKTNQLSA